MHNYCRFFLLVNTQSSNFLGVVYLSNSLLDCSEKSFGPVRIDRPLSVGAGLYDDLRLEVSRLSNRKLQSVRSYVALTVHVEPLHLKLIKKIILLNQLGYQTDLIEYYFNQVDVYQG